MDTDKKVVLAAEPSIQSIGIGK